MRRRCRQPMWGRWRRRRCGWRRCTFLSPGGTGNSASSGIWGMMSSGSSGSAKRGSRWISASFARTMTSLGVLFQPFLKALDVVQPFRWDRLSLHRHHASSAQMAMACRAISHRGQAVVSESVLAYSRQAGPGSLNPMEAAAAAGSLWGDGVWRAVALPPASFTRCISSRPMALPWRRSACLGLVPVCPYPGGRRGGQPVGDDGGVHAGGAQGCDCRCWASGGQGQGVGQPFGNFHRCRGLLQEWASQHHHGVLNCSVGPFIESAVHGGASVSGDEDQVDATRLWQVGPCLGPCSRLCRDGDDGSGSRVIVVKVFGADPAHWPGERQLWAPQMAVGEPLPGGVAG